MIFLNKYITLKTVLVLYNTTKYLIYNFYYLIKNQFVINKTYTYICKKIIKKHRLLINTEFL